MSCAVCFEPTSATLSPCGHVVCMQCAARWLARSPTCPVCRQTAIPTATDGMRSTVVIHFAADDFVGVTLHDSARGVAVLRTHQADLARKHGLRCGDVLDSINGVPLTTATQAVAIIDAGTLCRCPLHIKCRRRRVLAWWASRKVSKVVAPLYGIRAA